MFLQARSPDQPDAGLISGISPKSVMLYEFIRMDDMASSPTRVLLTKAWSILQPNALWATSLSSVYQ